MVPVREELPVPAPLSRVWPLLGDPAVVASCIPGAQLAPDKGDGVWRGSVRVKFGPTAAVFRGEAKLSFDDDAKRCRIEARGIDQRGASRALASFDISASGTDTTTLNIEGSFGVTGPLETFANAGGIHVMRALLAEFSNNIAALAVEGAAASESANGSTNGGEVPSAAPGGPAAPVADAAPSRRPHAAAPRELSAGRLLWLTLASWLRNLLGKRKT